MTATKDVTIWCDGRYANGQNCGAWVSGDTASDIRRELGRGRGRWLVGLPGGRDLCPDHHEQRGASSRIGDG